MSAAAARHPPMSATATLTNCYVPLPAISHSLESTAAFDPFSRPSDHHNTTMALVGQQPHPTSADAASKEQRRGPRTLRQIHLERSLLSQSNGSALVEWGHTKLMVSVRGPRPVNCSSMNAANNGGGLVCEGECEVNVYSALNKFRRRVSSFTLIHHHCNLSFLLCLSPQLQNIFSLPNTTTIYTNNNIINK